MFKFYQKQAEKQTKKNILSSGHKKEELKSKNTQSEASPLPSSEINSGSPIKSMRLTQTSIKSPEIAIKKKNTILGIANRYLKNYKPTTEQKTFRKILGFEDY